MSQLLKKRSTDTGYGIHSLRSQGNFQEGRLFGLVRRKQGNKLRRLMTFAWPCLLSKSCVDPATKYHGHLLLAHIIAKFAIHKRIVLQVRCLYCR